ncbi:MAG: hypothetical protein J6W69_02095 [Bacteroidales bacterium]|nr:hypothetical protein [Bacteroidales bacterium]
MKALRIMAVVMMAAFVGVGFVACGGQKAEAPAAAPEAVEQVAADSCAACCADSAACDSCAKACCDSAAACCADSAAACAK